jgi:hypothetical protein
MNRFLASSAAAPVPESGDAREVQSPASGTQVTKLEFYELRVFQLRRGPQHDQLSDFFRQAWVPAMNRLGIAPIGVFEVMLGPETPAIYTLSPFPSLEACATVAARLAQDAEYQKNGAAVINAPPARPAYVRFESSLMSAFEAMPRVQPPQFGDRQTARIFELRTYESHSRKANQKKIEMFNTAEIAIFRRNGLLPVFFGETLMGRKLPQLTYMLAFEGVESRDMNWRKFAADPEWNKLRATPGYTDPEIVSNISNTLLRPASYSQI